MKRILTALSFLLFISFATANAQKSPQDNKKTETKMKCDKEHMKCCGMMNEKKESSTKCDSTKCKGKCDPSKCKTTADGKSTGTKDCDPAKCKMMSKK